MNQETEKPEELSGNILKIHFYDDLVAQLKPKQNIIETRAITEAQIQNSK